MKKYFLSFLFLVSITNLFGQVIEDESPLQKTNTTFTIIKNNASTPVKNQSMTGTCWCFATTSLVESQCLKNNFGEVNISEMFTVRNIYIEKAKNYILRQGHTQFGEGGLGHDLIRAIATYGAVPEDVYNGLLGTQKAHNHISLFKNLKKYLDSVISEMPLKKDWLNGYITILDTTLGKAPEKFMYNGKEYSPKSFAGDILHFNANDYVNITSFTHHSYYEPFIIEVPDNFSNGLYYNIPLVEMIDLTKESVTKGYTILWDADVSNAGFQQRLGTAFNMEANPSKQTNKLEMVAGLTKEDKVDAKKRQELFENLTTQDDHLMHIVGLSKSQAGATFF